MVELTLVSKHPHPLKPLVEAALFNEVRLLEAGIRQTRQRLSDFESQHAMSTAEFISRFENDELTEDLDLVEWIGEYRLLKKLEEKVETLQGVEFAN